MIQNNETGGTSELRKTSHLCQNSSQPYTLEQISNSQSPTGLSDQTPDK